MKMMRGLGSVVLYCVLGVADEKATPLNLVPPNNAPDFMASFLKVDYAFATSTFEAIGFTTDYQNGSGPLSLTAPGNYSLTATITHAGILTGGTLTIAGDIGGGQETLLTGLLNPGASGVAFGFQDPVATPPRNLFEFLFTVTGGNPAVVTDYGGLGAPNREIIVNAFFQNGGTPFNGTWTSSFSNDGFSGVSDNVGTFFAVPEPASASLLLLAGATWLALARRSPLRRTFPLNSRATRY